MKTLRLLLLIGLISAFNNFLQSIATNKDGAIKIAQKFYSEKVHNDLRSGSEFQLVYTGTEKMVGNQSGLELVCYYVFNVGDNEGFVIVSGDDAIIPILAYSDKGSFPTEKIPENIKGWLDNYCEEIRYVLTNPNSKLLTTTSNKSSLRLANTGVAPLLGNICWNQNNPFNLLCPISTLYSERTVTGCTATAMAQVMKYYEWPVKGTGSKSYTFDLDGINTTLSASFGLTTYRWYELLDNYGDSSTIPQNSEAALLSYHCAVSAEMDFGTAAHGGSGATLFKAGVAYKTYFGYDPDIQLFYRDYFDLETWTQKLISEINAGRPVIYSGNSSEGGHTFVCDGYDNDSLFHINWGWGGYANGYFVISLLNYNYPGLISLKEGFSQRQQTITGIQKNDGVSNQNYNLCINNAGMTSNKYSIGDIGSELFNVSVGYANFGLNTFNGYLRASLYKDGVFQKSLQQIVKPSLNPNGCDSLTFNNLSLSGLAEGIYKLYLVYQPTGSSILYKFNGKATLTNHLNITLTGNSAIITIPSGSDNEPVLNISPDRNVDVQIYPNPIKDNVYIKFNSEPQDGTLITVFDFSGKVILQSKAENKEECLNLREYPAGSYFIKIDNQNPMKYKVIKE